MNKKNIIFLAFPAVFSYDQYALASGLFIRTETVSRAVCGVSHYQTGSGSVCGTTYNLDRTSSCQSIEAEDSRCPIKSEIWVRNSVCGVERYKKGRGKVCGTEKMDVKIPSETEWSRVIKDGWSLVNQICFPTFPGRNGLVYHLKAESILSRKDLEVSPGGRSNKVTKTVYRKLCTYETDKECEHSAFGVAQYNNCVVGTTYERCVVGYESCRHPNHGVESFLTCQDPSFGVVFNSCKVPDVTAQSQTIDSLSNQALTLETAKSALVSASLATPTNALLISIKATLENSLQKLNNDLGILQAQLTATSDTNALASLNEKIVESSKTISDFQNTVIDIDSCLAGTTSSGCKVDYTVAVSQIDSQIQKTKEEFLEIKGFLESELKRLTGIEDDLVKKIQNLLDSDVLKSI